MQVFLFVYIMFRVIFQLIGWVIKGFLYVLWMIFGGIAYLVNYLVERKTIPRSGRYGSMWCVNKSSNCPLKILSVPFYRGL